MLVTDCVYWVIRGMEGVGISGEKPRKDLNRSDAGAGVCVEGGRPAEVAATSKVKV